MIQYPRYINLLLRARVISKVSKNAEEACVLIEAGIEFVCNTPDEFMVFRKRK
jgi:hypothetical protein